MVLAPFFDITVFVAALTFRFLGERLKDLWRKEDWGVRVEEEEEEEEKREIGSSGAFDQRCSDSV